MNNRRAKNLSLARGIFGTQREIASMIAPNNSAIDGKLTRQCQGAIPISDVEADHYAERLKLPKGWFDRDNERLLKLSDSEYSLVDAALIGAQNLKYAK